MVAATLAIIRSDIDRRVEAITQAHPDWPCRAGCDHCCRRLAQATQLTTPEWEDVAGALRLLPADVQHDIAARLRSMPSSGPLTCPMLDTDSGLCLIYEHRPAACRTYGFYVERGIGVYCDIIEQRAASGELDDVTWGNQCAIDARLDGLGESLSLKDWFDSTFEPAEGGRLQAMMVRRDTA